MGLHALEVRPGSPTKPVPGWDVRVLDDGCNEIPRGETGAISIKLPMPPGFLLTLWNADERFIDTYLAEYPGYYKTADAGFMDDDGYLSIMSRTDDIINVAGHRLSTGGMEEVLAGHSDVAECAVIGVWDHIKGQLPLGFLVLNTGVTKENDLVISEVVQLVRIQIGPISAFKLAIVVDRLPKTRSGKILRGTMQKIANNQDYKMPATIDDPSILSEIDNALQAIGYSTARKA